ncbi:MULTISPECIES: bifunctional 3'-5' exonuclease/DNA polymerase [unclassified Microbacterium]|uniref:bifunctional 3'-5' exonuclease/DNA polymerase n=1 Tax=unclassified Microbacterium TaxID=2609290 RepID=UPI00214AD137|nr:MULTISPECIES: bifunctional 3'-5' exonuclease/DNA polymerase [unclassified Microbacterium]MCR2785600.1 bifunctional 3'-5' exonuclease/DNA polymerase [Microbacterium sp. zg.B96]WIM17415.1 bifunctional 3'-5' exonuclease/DNA polymerase [Microbacterium sp. zg-B96]
MAESDPAPTWIVVGRTADGVAVALLDADGTETGRRPVADLPAWVAETEATHAPRWVWNDTPSWYDAMLATGIRVARCHDLRLSHAILRDCMYVTDAAALHAAGDWDAAVGDIGDAPPALFELDAVPGRALPDGLDDALAEFRRQRDALASARDPGRLRLLIAAESAGALLAAEMRAAGLPWDADAHDALLSGLLGSRPPAGGVPRELERAAGRVREALGDPTASLDSQPKLLRALHRVGVLAQSTSKWELAQYDHPAIAPLLEYKKLARLMSANGWAWLDEWVRDGRFHPVYVPGGVVTGRWASSGGGALQLPRQLRGAVRADPGWVLVVADVAQLEPRVLAAMSGDTALADAARGRDLYAGIVARGALQTRAEAKVAMLGAMYGATTGDSGRLVPALRRAFPRAMALVDDAARIGEDGGIVATRLGRTSPPASGDWRAAQGRAGEAEATDSDESRARRWARDRGRFTRNFVVQGTAAEWALAWLADLRGRLAALPPVPQPEAAPRSGAAFERRAHLAFFLHDEVIIHAPAAQADAAAQAAVDAADAAGRLLFGSFPLDFPLDLRIAESAQKD